MMTSSFKDLTRPKTSKQFISASEIEENRQHQIELYRRLGQDIPPEPVHDTRSLAERLQDAKLAKQEQEELERNSLRNYVSILDQDDVEYLNDVAQMQMQSEQERLQLENQELEQFRILNQPTTSPKLIPVTHMVQDLYSLSGIDSLAQPPTTTNHPSDVPNTFLKPKQKIPKSNPLLVVLPSCQSTTTSDPSVTRKRKLSPSEDLLPCTSTDKTHSLASIKLDHKSVKAPKLVSYSSSDED